MPSPPPTVDELETETLDADCLTSDLVYILNRLKFHNGKATVKVDRAARDYILTAIKSRCGIGND